MSLFLNQSKIILTLDTKIDLSTATVKRILYVKPNGDKGYWAANVSGTSLTYQLTVADLDRDGPWQFQAYVEFGSDKSYGEIVFQQVSKPLT